MPVPVPSAQTHGKTPKSAVGMDEKMSPAIDEKDPAGPDDSKEVDMQAVMEEAMRQIKTRSQRSVLYPEAHVGKLKGY